DWKAFFAQGLGAKLVEPGTVVPAGEVLYDGQSPDPLLAEILDEAVALARVELGRDLMRQGGAMGRMAARYRDAFEEVQLARGGFRFADITHLLRESRVLGAADDLYFRLDARIRHLLLDEFQDTSLPQWEVLEPLVEELLSGEESGRAAVLVADPKQSIYGWRGARPELVDRVGDRYALERRDLPWSFRSGPPILEAVAGVFQGLEANPVIREVEGGSEVARAWVRDFFPQQSAHPGKPGFVRMVVGPRTDGRSTVQPALLEYAAGLIGEVHAHAPGASVGVLVRANVVVSSLIAALRSRGIPASGEGGTPLTDVQPVNALLALLRLADFPGNRLARYHVAQTPVGEMVGFDNFQAGAEADRLARQIRGRLLRDGYGATLDQWVRALEDSCDDRERARLLQLVELGFRWDPERTLRPGDFVRFVEGEGVEDPSGARVRVMTVHQAKGLEFDAVVLPHLYPSLGGRGSTDPASPLRDPDTGRVVRIYPATDKGTRALFPELGIAHAQGRALGLRDELSTLYVAMTRAKYALHMVVPADGERGAGTAKSFARLLRAALAPGEAADVEGKVLYHHGDERWVDGVAAGDLSGDPLDGAGRGLPAHRPTVTLRPASGGRTGNLARRSPSSLEGGEGVDLSALLRMDLSGSARERGILIHAWCERIGWIEDGLPDETELRAIARERAPGVPADRVAEWLSAFRRWMSVPEISDTLSRSRYPEGGRVERELPFLHRGPDGILQGFIDRLVILEEGERVVGAEVLDFKTDLLDGSDPEAVAAKVAYYRPQMEAYREAVVGRYGLPPSAVTARLLFLRPGLVREA
ncbi:MAG: UvrD-helicase domain-containing protein, partial [Longimicrobiales bacterium]